MNRSFVESHGAVISTISLEASQMASTSAQNSNPNAHCPLPSGRKRRDDSTSRAGGGGKDKRMKGADGTPRTPASGMPCICPESPFLAPAPTSDDGEEMWGEGMGNFNGIFKHPHAAGLGPFDPNARDGPWEDQDDGGGRAAGRKRKGQRDNSVTVL